MIGIPRPVVALVALVATAGLSNGSATARALDQSFGHMGIATAGTPGFFLSLDVFEAGPQQGKIVAGGTQTYAYGDPAFGELITRFTPDGHPDQGFGDGGVVVLPWKNSRPNGVTGTAAEADGSTRS